MRLIEMEIPLISKRQFNRFRKHLPPVSNAEKIPAIVVLSCVIWVIKSGVPWSHIPEKYGKFDTIRKRFSRWSKNGIFRKVFQSLASMAGKSNTAMIDSTTVNAHRTASSLASDGNPRKIGRSAGGLTTKIHLIANIEKIPLDFSLTEGQVNDAKEGENLVRKNSWRMKSLLADKAYDTNAIRSDLKKAHVSACIPPKSNRIEEISYDKELYEKRSIIENMFGSLKDWRAIKTRYCRCAHTFDSFVCVALVTIFLYVR